MYIRLITFSCPYLIPPAQSFRSHNPNTWILCRNFNWTGFCAVTSTEQPITSTWALKKLVKINTTTCFYAFNTSCRHNFTIGEHLTTRWPTSCMKSKDKLQGKLWNVNKWLSQWIHIHVHLIDHITIKSHCITNSPVLKLCLPKVM